MKDLDSFSIETDDLVLLTYADGTSRRARLEVLPQLLKKADLRRIKSAFRMRRRFHGMLPSWLRVFTVTVLLLMAGFGTVKAVSLVVSPATHTVHHGSNLPKSDPASGTADDQDLTADSAAASTTPSASAGSTGEVQGDSTLAAIGAATPTATPEPIALPLGLKLPNPAPLVPNLVRHAAEPVSHTLHSLGL